MVILLYSWIHEDQITCISYIYQLSCKDCKHKCPYRYTEDAAKQV